MQLLLRLYFRGVQDSSMAAFDMMEGTMNCYVTFGVDIVGMPVNGVWNIIVSHRLQMWHLRLNLKKI